jgi:hypothetical protein
MRVRTALVPLFPALAVAACSLNPQVEPMPGLKESAKDGGSSRPPILSNGGQGGANYGGAWQIPGAGGFTQGGASGAGGATSQGGAYSGTGGFPGDGSVPPPPIGDSGAPADGGPDAPADGGTDSGTDGHGGMANGDASRRKDAGTD